MKYTNAKVQPLTDPWPIGRGLEWEIRGYIDGVWVNIPHYTQAQAQAQLDQLTGAQS